MSEDTDYVKKLVKKRDSAARRIARSSKSLLESVRADSDDSSVDAARIDRDELEKCFLLFEEVQNEIELEMSGDELSAQEEERIRIENIVRQARVSASSFLRRSTLLSSPSHNASVSAVNTVTKIKRPEITVPKFSGEVKKWSEFKNVFKSLVIDEKAYSNVERMIYLKQAVESKAAEVISNFEISAQNFDKAWEKLRNRYENKRAVISSHLEALCKLPYAKSETELSPLLDAATDAIESLTSVGVENGWQMMLCHLVSSKLDSETRKQWELSTIKESEHPTYAQLERFLQQRVKVFESIGMTNSSAKTVIVANPKKEKPNMEKARVLLTKESTEPKMQSTPSTTITGGARMCFDCGASNHSLIKCKSFAAKTLEEKTQVVQKRGLCFNCLNRGHRVAMCRLKRCDKCSKKHHPLLHRDETPAAAADANVTSVAVSVPASPTNAEVTKPAASTAKSYLVSPANPTHVCLPAALVYVFARNGRRHLVRAILDSGSSINAISEKLAKKLQCCVEKSQITLATLMPGEYVVNTSCNVLVKSRVSKYQFSGKFHIAPAIANDFTSFDRTSISREVLAQRKMADQPTICPGRVDLLIGAEFFEELMMIGKIKIGDKAYLRETELGWVFIGLTNVNYSVFFDQPSTCFLTVESNFQKFWLVDELFEPKDAWTEEEKRVDAEYEATWARMDCGNFLLFLPKNMAPDVLGESRSIAFNRLLALEKRLKRNEVVGKAYNGFLVEYELLKHMSLVHPSLALVHLPHHAVFKDSTTTSTRVVFDAAALTSSGYSLNDFLAKGPVLQEDLFSILVRFRVYKVAFTADIEKMYRQIFIQPEDRKYQCILWRHPNSGFIGTYQLNTVTYGTKPASYLATKCLFKLAELFSEQFPESAKIIKSDFYMDDLLSGANSVEEAQVRIQEIVKILDSAGFPLRKFASSDSAVLAQLNPQLIVQSRSFEDVEMVSVLGVKWTGSDQDCFKFFNKISEPEAEASISKRGFLSRVFRIYDPLGLLAPVVNALKFLLQDLWRHKLDWDDPIPTEILKQFKKICVELKELEHLSIPRWTGFSINSEIHVFCDASQRGFGAAVYVRTVSESGEFVVRLLCAKSRVAPLKVISIPRLELCSALLGAKLFRTVKLAIRLPEQARIFAWSDSTIVLSWLYFDSGNWSTFVANRVSKIRDIIHPENWYHVSSESNAADLISRGLNFDLSKLEDFWNGPKFLLSSAEFLRPVELDPQSLSESKAKAKSFFVAPKGDLFLQRFSRYESLIAMVGFVMRFAKRLRSEEVESNSLTAFERLRAHKILIRKVQKTVMDRISKLDSFLDEDGIWRLRSRVGKSDLTFETAHPVILPKDRFLLLLIRYWHVRFFHAGVSFLKNFVRTSYFVLGDLNRVVRSVVHACPTCRRFASELGYKPPIGELPSCRVTVSQAFVQVGVDFAGPILTRAVGPSKNRGKVLFKSYVCIFVCMASRAVHIEVVEDLTTKAFVECLDRFVARRGLSHTIYSDHGTNFVGANRELRAAFEFLKKNRSELLAHCARSGIEWKFIPERAPHFGGLWESAVKSFKFHFKRVVGTQILSFAELSTLGCRIEAVLNSRPLCSSADNLSMVITPAHLCIGRSVSIVPSLVGEVMKGSTKLRYSLVQSIFDRFWALWSREYLIALRSAYFKKNGARQAQVEDVVLVKEDNVSPTYWPLGRIVRLFPGSDGVARVADVLVNGRIFRRPVVKLVPLLSD